MQTLQFSPSSRYTLAPTRDVGEFRAKLAKCTGKQKRRAILSDAARRIYPKFAPGMSTAEYVRDYESANSCRSLTKATWDNLNDEPCTLYSGEDSHQTLPDGFATWEEFDAAQSTDTATVVVAPAEPVKPAASAPASLLGALMTGAQFTTAVLRINYPMHQGKPNPAHGLFFFAGSIPAGCYDVDTGRSHRYPTEDAAIAAAFAAGATHVQRCDCSFAVPPVRDATQDATPEPAEPASNAAPVVDVAPVKHQSREQYDADTATAAVTLSRLTALFPSDRARAALIERGRSGAIGSRAAIAAELQRLAESTHWHGWREARRALDALADGAAREQDTPAEPAPTPRAVPPATKADPASGRITFRALRVGDIFQFDPNGPIWIRVRGGFRLGLGGQLHSCAPGVSITRYRVHDPAPTVQTAQAEPPATQSDAQTMEPVAVESESAPLPGDTRPDLQPEQQPEQRDPAPVIQPYRYARGAVVAICASSGSFKTRAARLAEHCRMRYVRRAGGYVGTQAQGDKLARLHAEGRDASSFTGELYPLPAIPDACKHPPARLYCGHAKHADGIARPWIACCDCGDVLTGGATREPAEDAEPAAMHAARLEVARMSPIDSFDYLADFTDAEPRDEHARHPDAMRAAVLQDLHQIGPAEFLERINPPDEDETAPVPLDGLDVAELGAEGLAEFERAQRDAYRAPTPSLRIPATDPRARIPARFAPGYMLRA